MIFKMNENQLINQEIMKYVTLTSLLYPNSSFAQILTMLGVDPQNQSHYRNESILSSVKSMYNFLKKRQNGN
jgi:hypothetical protein